MSNRSNKPSIGALSFALRHKELWPADFHWDYSRCETCAMGLASPWITVQEKAVRAMVALSMRLRLSPQSRIDPKTAGRRQEFQGPRPWEI